MSNIVKYFENQAVNIVTVGEDTWFKGRDVAVCLGYTDTAHAILDHVEECDRISGQFDRKLGRPATYVNESGMYALIFGSKKPEARRFKHWVTSRVLPEIRRTGGYGNGDSELGARLDRLEGMIVAMRQNTLALLSLPLLSLGPSPSKPAKLSLSLRCPAYFDTDVPGQGSHN